jgi:hypothetical protein
LANDIVQNFAIFSKTNVCLNPNKQFLPLLDETQLNQLKHVPDKKRVAYRAGKKLEIILGKVFRRLSFVKIEAAEYFVWKAM